MGGVALIIPVINEAETIAAVVRDVPRSTFDVVIVVDGGSTDMTAARARQAGALVIVESQSGYGAACLAGIRAAPADCHIVAFIDGDGSDDPHDIPRLVSPIQSGAQDFVIGSRARGRREPGTWGSTRSSRDIAPALSFKRSMACGSPTWARYARSGVMRSSGLCGSGRAAGTWKCKCEPPGPACGSSNCRFVIAGGPAAPPRLQAASAAQSKRPGN
jgi:glycosyltransferase involved in cell wall biosynthesis